jgi:hypothetical protein
LLNTLNGTALLLNKQSPEENTPSYEFDDTVNAKALERDTMSGKANGDGTASLNDHPEDRDQFNPSPLTDVVFAYGSGFSHRHRIEYRKLSSH